MPALPAIVFAAKQHRGFGLFCHKCVAFGRDRILPQLCGNNIVPSTSSVNAPIPE
ncbi:MAG: hypothetical protein HC773_09395 [Scytonema sp. CRU_2_7]|nr:hypothetical protein [Scytonema sp. CRU_2_7]